MEAEISVITCPCVDRISESLRENDKNSILDGKCRKSRMPKFWRQTKLNSQQYFQKVWRNLSWWGTFFSNKSSRWTQKRRTALLVVETDAEENCRRRRVLLRPTLMRTRGERSRVFNQMNKEDKECLAEKVNTRWRVGKGIGIY